MKKLTSMAGGFVGYSSLSSSKSKLAGGPKRPNFVAIHNAGGSGVVVIKYLKS
jgi:hypothetical protein